jgi:hypothetical protein
MRKGGSMAVMMYKLAASLSFRLKKIQPRGGGHAAPKVGAHCLTQNTALERPLERLLLS